MSYRIKSRFQPDLSEKFKRIIDPLGQWKLHGRSEIVAEYEDLLGTLFESTHVISCNSGTTALELALRVASGPESTVVMPALTSVMAYLPVETLGLRVIIVDSAPGSIFPSLEQYDALNVREAPPGSVLLTTSWWGYTPSWSELRELCNAREWSWIDDMAQAHGSVPDAPLNLPNFRCYSTHDRKLLTTGEGGFVCTEDSDAARRISSYASYGGLPPGASDLTLGREAGGNRRLSTLQAAYGLCSARALTQVVHSRRAVMDELEKTTAGLVHLAAHDVPPGAHLNGYGLVLRSSSTDHARHFEADYLRSAGIQNDVADYDLKPIQEYELPKARGLSGPTPNASALSERLLVISPHQGLSRPELDYISDALRALDARLGLS